MLEHFCAAARRTLLDSALQFGAPAIAALREDFADVERAFVTA